MPTIELITHKLCPYVQRSIIVLEEKGIPYHRTDIDLANKPAWFERLSPLGKVPLLLLGENKPIFESAVICEYLDEVTPGTLHPEDAAEKARHRSWIEFSSHILNRIGALYSAGDRDGFDQARQQLRQAFEQLEEALAAGPFFGGPAFSLVDAAFAPVFRYFEVFESFVELGVFDGLERLQQWRSLLQGRASVRAAVAPEYGQLLKAFVSNRQGYLASLLERQAVVAGD